MTPEQIALLVDVVAKAVNTFAWVAGVSVTVMIAVTGVLTNVVYRSMARRIDDVGAVAMSGQTTATSAVESLKDFGTHCAKMRATCREELLGQFVPRVGIKAMDDDVKLLVEQAINATQAQVIEIKESLEKFQTDFWDAFHGHRHADDGAVIRNPNPKRKI